MEGGLPEEFPCAVVEQTREDTVVLRSTRCGSCWGRRIRLLSRSAGMDKNANCKANLAVASNPDTAILLARHVAGFALVTPGEERFKLGPLAVAYLFRHDAPVDPKLLQVLHRWGIQTCEELAALPERGVAERLGAAGVYCATWRAARCTVRCGWRHRGPVTRSGWNRSIRCICAFWSGFSLLVFFIRLVFSPAPHRVRSDSLSLSG